MTASILEFVKTGASDSLPYYQSLQPSLWELGLLEVLTGQGHLPSPCGNCSRALSPIFNFTGVKALFLFKPLLTTTLSGGYSYLALELRSRTAQ